MKSYEKFVTIVTVLLLMVCVPLYLHNAYFDVTTAKAGAFLVCSCVAVPLIIAAFILRIRKHAMNRLLLMDMGIIAYAVIAVASAFLSGDMDESLWGMSCWGVGALVIAVLALVYLFISRAEYIHNLWLVILAVNGLLLLWVILNAAGLDPFGLHDGVYEPLRYDYYSTYGNLNQVSLYLCLMYPAAFGFYLNTEKRADERIYLTFLIPATCAIAVQGSDSIFIGIGLVFAFGLKYIMSDGLRLRKLSIILMIYGGALLALRYLPCFAERAARLSGICSFVMKPVISITILILGAAGTFFIEKFYKRIGEKTRHRLYQAVQWLLVVVFLGVIGYSVLTFSDDWGTNRGGIWRMSLQIYLRDFTLKQKLIGIGPEMLHTIYQEVSAWHGMSVVSSHSEPIQILLTCGLAGLAAWAAIWISVFVNCFRRGVLRSDKVVFLLPIAAYFGQSFVNTTTAMTASAFVIMLALYRKSLDDNDTLK